MIRGNKGEWSEFYVFLKLLSERRLYGADNNLQKIEEILYPVLKIVREEAIGRMNYELVDNQKVRIFQNGTEIALVNSSDLKLKIGKIFKIIRDSSKTTFSVSAANEFMSRFHARKLNAGNARKEDLILKIHDSAIKSEPEVGFSIKSMLGSPATLLNASVATNFTYRITGLPTSKIKKVNLISGRSKIRDRLGAIILAGGKIGFVGVDSDIFEKNLRKVDTVLPEIVAELLLAYYFGKGSKFSELMAHMKDNDIKILSFSLDASDYEFKLKALLHNIALGMVPGTVWDGLLRAHGGYIIVREDGEIVCYHVYNADKFRSYLFKNTKLETPSTTRHKYGVLYRKGGDIYFKLNFQIRFLK